MKYADFNEAIKSCGFQINAGDTLVTLAMGNHIFLMKSMKFSESVYTGIIGTFYSDGPQVDDIVLYTGIRNLVCLMFRNHSPNHHQ